MMSVLKKSPLRFRSYDPLETPRLPLAEARRQVFSSLGVVANLLDPNRRGAIVHNARVALVAGLALASKKSVTLLQEGDFFQPIDYRDIVRVYSTAEQIERALEPIIRQVVVSLQDVGTASRRPEVGLLERLDLGDVAAENETRSLADYFVPTAAFQDAKRGNARLVVGRKGSGKTAIFYAVRNHFYRRRSHLVLDLKPEGHQFTKFHDAVLSRLSPGLKEHTLVAFWNYILLAEMAQKIIDSEYSYSMYDPDRRRAFDRLAEVLSEHVPSDAGDFSERLLRSRLKTLNVAEFERAYSSSHIQVSPQTLNRKACMMSTPRMQYATDLTDGQWQRIEPLLPAPRWRLHGPGRPPRDRRQIVNGLLYLNKTGCPWALLPCCFGPWKTGYDYFRRWSLQGVWPQVLDQLTQRERRRNGRAATPSAGCVDSQTIKTATQGKTTGYDAGKKIKGRKRHLLVDTSGLLRQVVVTAADVDDRDGLKQVLTRLKATGVARLRKLWADGGYQGAAIRTWVANRKKTHKIDLEIVAKQGGGFTVLKRRWVVERTLAWLMNFRRHARDYEVLTRHSEALIQVAMIHLLLKRIK